MLLLGEFMVEFCQRWTWVSMMPKAAVVFSVSETAPKNCSGDGRANEHQSAREQERASGADVVRPPSLPPAPRPRPSASFDSCYLALLYFSAGLASLRWHTLANMSGRQLTRDSWKVA